MGNILRTIVFAIYIITLFGCSSAAKDSASKKALLIKINPISVDVVKRKTIKTPDVRLFVIDNETGGTSSVIDWNKNTIAQYGDVTYDGNGIFTYTPRLNIETGTDSFSFQVQNAIGTTEIGLVTLNIQAWWEPSVEFEGHYNPYLTELGNHTLLQYSNPIGAGLFPRVIRKLDPITHSWLNPVNVDNSHRSFVDSVKQVIKFFDATSDASGTVLRQRVYNPNNSNTELLSIPTDIEVYSGRQLVLQRFTSDKAGNIFLLLNEGTTVYGKYFDASSGNWNDLTKVYDSLGVLGSSFPFVANGNPIVVVTVSGQIPIIYTYDSLLSTWSPTPLSTELSVSVSSIKFDQNSLGDVLISWTQIVTDNSDPINPVDYHHLKASVYRSTKELITDQTLARVPTVDSIRWDTHLVGATDFLILWRPYNLIQGCENDFFAQYFDVSNNSFDSSATLIAANVGLFVCGSLTQPIIDKKGNILVYWYIDSAGTSTYFIRNKPYRQAWDISLQVNNTPFNTTPLTSIVDIRFTADQQDHVYTIYKSINNNNGDYEIKRYNYANKSFSAPVAADDSTALMNTPRFTLDNTNNILYLYWTRLSPDLTTNDVCFKKILQTATFDESSLEAEDCMFTGLPIDISIKPHIYHDLNKNTYVFITDHAFTAFNTKINNTWSDHEIIYSPVLDIGLDNLYNNYSIYQYGNGNIFSLIMYQQQETAGASLPQVRTIFSMFYN